MPTLLKTSSMRVALFFLVTVIAMTAAHAQLPSAPKAYKGCFFVNVNDGVTLFLNGKEVFNFGVGTHQSPDLEIREGDRIVARLRDQGGGCDFILAFRTGDEKSVASFKASDFKVAPNNTLTDFTVEEFKDWKKHARKIKTTIELPVKNYSHDVWGYTMDCTLGSVVVPEMFSQIPY
jgi:hypothetical protein